MRTMGTVEIEMALEVGLAQTRGSLATLFKHEESGDRETVELHRVSFSNVGSASLAGGMTVRSKRLSVVTAEPSNNSCPHLETLIVSSCSSSKATVNSGSLVSSPAVHSQPVLNVLQKKHNSSVTDKRHSVKWLDAMKAQSPPRFHSLHGDTPESYDIEAAKYAAWMKQHPSALSVFKEVMVEAKAKQVVVFLDYDGTLSPIVEDPDQAYMPNDMRVIVKEVATYFPTAIISGRARPKVYEFVQLAELYYAGSHGMDIMGPANGTNGFKAKGTQMKDEMGNDVVLFQPASEYLPLMDEVCKILSESSKGIRGARVEHNRFCVTMHFRCVKEESWGPLAEKVESVLKDYPTLCLTHGRKVLEIRPAIAWDKGKAVDFLLSSLGLSDCRDVFPVYIGDDRTDEDAFKVLNGLNHGCSILVTSVPKETKASFSLRDPSEVMDFLRHLVIWKEQDLEVHTGMGMVHHP